MRSVSSRSAVSMCAPILALLAGCSQPASTPAPAAAPAAPAPGAAPAVSQVERGHMLIIGGGCHDCHTPKKMGPNGPEFLSNHAGGILGGISTGQPVVCRFAVKPTSSILTPRQTVTQGGAEVDLITKGRHDPCVGIRAVPVGEAMMACVLLDHLLMDRGQTGGVRGRIG